VTELDLGCRHPLLVENRVEAALADDSTVGSPGHRHGAPCLLGPQALEGSGGPLDPVKSRHVTVGEMPDVPVDLTVVPDRP